MSPLFKKLSDKLYGKNIGPQGLYMAKSEFYKKLREIERK